MTTIRRLCRPMTALLVALALVAVAAAPATAGGLDDERSPKVKVTGKKLKASDDIGTADDPAVGKSAPGLKALDLDGEKVTFADDGTPRIVLFLSHSCPHCQAEVPVIVELEQEGAFEGVEVDTVATNTSSDLPNWPPSEWLADEKWPFEPVLADDANLRAFSAYGGDAFPYFVFVGADGKVAARVSGELSKDTLTEAVRRLVAGESFFEQAQR